MLAERDDELKFEELMTTARKEEIKNTLAAAEFDAKIVVGYRQDGSHPNHENLVKLRP